MAILVALFSASGGVNNLMTAINVAYDEEDKRSAIKKRLIAFALTLGAIVFIVDHARSGRRRAAAARSGSSATAPWSRFLLQAARWILLVVLVTVALAVLYRVAPDRDAPKMRWVSVGAGAATVLWLIASIGFSVYVSTFGNYAKTYGVFAGIIVLLFWLWITSYAILLGRRDQRRGRAADRGRHHQGPGRTDRPAQCGQGGFDRRPGSGGLITACYCDSVSSILSRSISRDVSNSSAP